MARIDTIEQLLTKLNEDNYDHIEFVENMNGGDCDCPLHTVMNFLFEVQRKYNKGSIANV